MNTNELSTTFVVFSSLEVCETSLTFSLSLQLFSVRQITEPDTLTFDGPKLMPFIGPITFKSCCFGVNIVPRGALTRTKCSPAGTPSKQNFPLFVLGLVFEICFSVPLSNSVTVTLLLDFPSTLPQTEYPDALKGLIPVVEGLILMPFKSPKVIPSLTTLTLYVPSRTLFNLKFPFLSVVKVPTSFDGSPLHLLLRQQYLCLNDQLHYPQSKSQ